jgi:hypothetical protein
VVGGLCKEDESSFRLCGLNGIELLLSSSFEQGEELSVGCLITVFSSVVVRFGASLLSFLSPRLPAFLGIDF